MFYPQMKPQTHIFEVKANRMSLSHTHTHTHTRGSPSPGTDNIQPISPPSVRNYPLYLNQPFTYCSFITFLLLYCFFHLSNGIDLGKSVIRHTAQKFFPQIFSAITLAKDITFEHG